MASLLRNQKVRNALLQVLYVGTLGALVLSGALIARQNLAAQGLTSGFDFLFKSTGWDLNFSLLPATATEPTLGGTRNSTALFRRFAAFR